MIACKVPGRLLRDLVVGSLVIAVLFVIATVLAQESWDIGPSYPDEHYVDRVQRTTKTFADDAYPKWRRKYGEACPRSIYELSEFADSVTTLDPWGEPYQLSCTNGRIVVISTGQDRIPNTADDFRSDQ